MRKTLSIALVDLRMFFASRANLVSITALPIILTLLLGGTFAGGGATMLRVDVLDNDNSDLSQAFIAELRAVNDTLLLCPADQDDDDVCNMGDDANLTVQRSVERVENDNTAGLLVIPNGYSEAVLTFAPLDMTYYSLADVTTGDPMLQAVQVVVQRINAAIVAARVGVGLGDTLTGPADDGSIFVDDDARVTFSRRVYDEAVAAWEQRPVTVRFVTTAEGEQASGQPTVTGFSQSVPGMATMFVMFTVLGAMDLLLRERKQWTMQRLVVMPVTRTQIVGGKILSRFTLGMIQFLIVFAVGLIVGVDFGSAPLGLLVIMVAYTLCITALAFAIAPRIRSEGQAASLTTMLSLVLAALGGAWWTLEVVPPIMNVIGHLSPVAWAMDGFTEILFYGGGLVDVLPFAAVLLVAAAVLFVIGVRSFQYD